MNTVDLSNSCFISKYLHQIGLKLTSEWEQLAELLGFNYQKIREFERIALSQRNVPALLMLEEWAKKNDYNVDILMEKLEQMERLDCQKEIRKLLNEYFSFVLHIHFLNGPVTIKLLDGVGSDPLREALVKFNITPEHHILVGNNVTWDSPIYLIWTRAVHVRTREVVPNCYDFDISKPVASNSVDCFYEKPRVQYDVPLFLAAYHDNLEVEDGRNDQKIANIILQHMMETGQRGSYLIAKNRDGPLNEQEFYLFVPNQQGNILKFLIRRKNSYFYISQGKFKAKSIEELLLHYKNNGIEYADCCRAYLRDPIPKGCE